MDNSDRSQYQHDSEEKSGLQKCAMSDYSQGTKGVASPAVSLQCAADITPEAISWLWDGWLAKGKLHILAGAAGTGKTTLALSLAAIITQGGKFPDGSLCPAGSVLIWSGEDSAADTLVPRLIAAGADRTKVHFVETTNLGFESRSFDPANDMQALKIKAAQLPDLAMLILDPIVNAVASDSHKNGEVRRALQPVVDFASKLNCAVVGITHLSKGTQGKEPLERVTGSLAFGALARIVILTSKIKEGELTKRIVCRAKSNIGKDSDGYEYDLKGIEIESGIFTSLAVWGVPLVGEAIDLLTPPNGGSANGMGVNAVGEAKSFLLEILANGEVPHQNIEQGAKGAGISWASIRRAKSELGVISKKSLLGPEWYWRLPNYLQNNA